MKKLFKKLQKYYKKRQRFIKRIVVPFLIGLFLLYLGMFIQSVRLERSHPNNIVWAVDKTVQVPSDLRKMLMNRDDCKDYRGGNSPKGVGLWAVTQIEQGKFAKLAHGCSWSVSNQALAVKQRNSWSVVPAIEYFSDTTQGVPTCKAVVKYKVPIGLEGFCLNDVGKLSKNPNPN